MLRTPRRFAISAIAILCLAAPSALAADGMVPHHAEYNVSLAPVSGRPAIAGGGKMVLQVRDTCDGRALRNEMRLRLGTDGDRSVNSTMIQEYWESRDGTKFRFSLVNRVGGRIVQQVEGTASLPENGRPGVARYTGAAPKTVTLPAGTVFPFTFERRYAELWRAKGERKNYLLFDGASPDKGPMRVIARALRKAPLAAGIPRGDRALVEKTSRPYEFLYFSSSGADSGPYLSGIFLLQRNGITRGFSTETSGMTFRFVLKRLKSLPKAKC